MTSSTSTTDLPRTGTVTYVVPVNVTVDLDRQDQQYLDWDAESRTLAAHGMVSYLLAVAKNEVGFAAAAPEISVAEADNVTVAS